MEKNRQAIIEREVNKIREKAKAPFNEIELLGDMLSSIAVEYNISFANVIVDMPKTLLRPKHMHIEQTFFDKERHTEQSDTICVVQSISGGGEATITLIAENGIVWDAIDHKDLNLLLHVSYVHASQMVTSRLLEKATETDFPTGLYNQSGFFTHIERCLSHGEAEEYYIVFFNISNFKYVNKVFTYQEGDKVLIKYGSAIAKLVEGEECIGRMGGDNFVAYIHRDHIRRFVEQIDHVVVDHVANNIHKRFEFSAVKGVASMNNVSDSRTILGHCSLAYHVARKSHKSTVFFSTELYAKAMKQQDVIVHFQDAIDNKEFVVYYQPKVNTENCELCGAEALVRWRRDGKNHLPMEFVPLFEENGNICILDYYVLETVCRQLQQWKKNGRELVRISVNFSRRHLEEETFVDKVAAILSQYDIDPQYIEIELTESDDFQGYGIMSEVVADLKKLGITISIDDFGTGYSSLNMLKNTDFDIVKIDRSFIPFETDNEEQKIKNMAMFQSIMELIEILGMESVAEGVETKEQLAYFEKSKCHIVQGYIFDRPLPFEEFERRLIRRSYRI